MTCRVFFHSHILLWPTYFWSIELVTIDAVYSLKCLVCTFSENFEYFLNNFRFKIQGVKCKDTGQPVQSILDVIDITIGREET